MASQAAARSIVLFGRTGSGKSTLGNMLCTASPDPQGYFAVGDGFRGVTSTISIKDGRGWMVTDTIGFGEPETGTIGTVLAEKRLCKFLTSLKSGYLYIVYVVQQGRMQDSDALTWELFKKIFEGGESNFVVVFTHSTQKWVDENINDIRAEYDGCTRFLAVDFPPPVLMNVQRDKLNAEDRTASLTNFESTLKGYGFTTVYPNICRMTAEELFAHAKRTLMHLVRYVTNRFVTNAETPFDWLVRKLTGVLFSQ